MPLKFDAHGQLVEGSPVWHNGTVADDWTIEMLA
jgi:hypothetical protein